MTPALETGPGLADLLACPLCSAPLEAEVADGIDCPRCHRRYPIDDGVYDMRIEPVTGDGVAATADETPASTRRERTGRIIRRNRLELHILTHMLSGQPASRTLLDVSCRRGRFAGPMQSSTRLLIEADRRPESSRVALRAALNPPRVAALACDPESLPFARGGLDGVVCIRLSHHVDGASRRERILADALRVASRFVVFSFSESISVPVLWRRMRRRPDSLNTMSPARVRDLVAAHDARIAESVTVSPLGSRHRFVLIEKNPA